MACKRCRTKPVWEFTNQTKLCRSCFINYFESKIFRTIRKYNMLPKNREIRLKKDQNIDYNVLKSVLEKKFIVKSGDEFSPENLSESAEKTFSNIIKGNFSLISPTNPNKPLFFLSDREIELYSTLKKIRGKKRKENKRIKVLFQKFIDKNPDLEHNIVNALNQLH